jgi:hypothetical protein
MDAREEKVIIFCSISICCNLNLSDTTGYGCKRRESYYFLFNLNMLQFKPQ